MMALLFADSFDHYVTADLPEKWTSLGGSPSIQAAQGRNGSSSVRVGSNGHYLVRGIPNSTTVIVGVAWRCSSLAASCNLFALEESGSTHVSVDVTTGGAIRVGRGAGTSHTISTQLAISSGGLISVGSYYYVELKTTINDTTGSVELRLNGNPTAVASASSVDTRNSGTGTISQIILYVSSSAISGNFDYDDLYVSDDTGSAPWNTFLGDVRVDYRGVTGAGTTTQFTPSTGSNYQNVDDAAPNDDTDYNSSGTVGHIDTFVVQDAPVAGATIYGVQTVMSTKKTDAGTCSVAPMVGATPGTDKNPTTSYLYYTQMYQTDPATSVAWTEANFNAKEFGYKRTA